MTVEPRGARVRFAGRAAPSCAGVRGSSRCQAPIPLLDRVTARAS
jgi:hypothetical protein